MLIFQTMLNRLRSERSLGASLSRLFGLRLYDAFLAIAVVEDSREFRVILYWCSGYQQDSGWVGSYRSSNGSIQYSGQP